MRNTQRETKMKLGDLIAKAEKSGKWLVEQHGTSFAIVRRHKRTRKILDGFVIYQDGSAFDATVDLSVAKRLTLKNVAAQLGV